ncbi:MAG: hypothetical protein ABEI57_02100 [Halapricum sp.]
MANTTPLQGSALYAAYDRLRRDAKRARVTRLLSAIASTSAVALEHSRLGTGGRALERWIRGSYLYRWLTSEPDPDVVVIDLRETWTVGPIIAILEWMIEPLANYWSGASLRTVLDELLELFRRAPIRFFGVIGTIVISMALVLSFATGTTSSALGVKLCLLALTFLATRIDTSWERLRDGPVGQAFKAVFEPPEPPESTPRDRTDRDDSE